MGIMFVPQQEAWVVERMGKFSKILNPVENFVLHNRRFLYLT